ncbi:MAG: class I SAM-dependent methyltransferase [Gammaproteobacteria bacterium]
MNGSVKLNLNSIDFFNFATPSLIYRLKHGGGGKQAIAKAIKVSGKEPLKVIDATAGFGTDSLILASLNCHIYAIERNPTIAKLLQNRLLAAQNNNFLAPLVKNITLIVGDSRTIIPELVQKNQYNPDVIYLDPMFSANKKRTAASKKQIQILQSILANSEQPNPEYNDLNLLKTCINYAKKRVVVKRPKISEHLDNIKPNFSLIGKANRFDIYLPNNTIKSIK